MNHRCWCYKVKSAIILDLNYKPSYEDESILDFIIFGNYQVYFPKINKIGSYFKKGDIFILKYYNKKNI